MFIVVQFILLFMTPYAFFELDEMEQAELIWEGVHIGESQDDEHNILLYQINDLFVEVYYQRQDNVIRKFIAYTEQGLKNSRMPKN